MTQENPRISFEAMFRKEKSRACKPTATKRCCLPGDEGIAPSDLVLKRLVISKMLLSASLLIRGRPRRTSPQSDF